jgi:mannose-6-phosphate isomerase-like protein (cupin superfamily)
MSTSNRSLKIASILIIACGCTQAGADVGKPEAGGDRTAIYTSTADIEADIAKTTGGSAARQLKTDSTTAVWAIRRDAPGQVELHRKFNDVIVAREGTVTVLIGEKVEGNREIKPNEWLGGKIIGGRTYTLAPGDVLFIPAGLGHLMTPPSGGSFSYLVVKTEAAQ